MKKIFNYLLVSVLCLIMSINGVKAKTYAKDLFQAGNKLTINEELKGTSFLAGRDIKINKSVDGVVFVAGQDIKINSDEEYVFGAGSTIVLTKNINKDLFLAAEEIDIKESNIKRDAYLAANEIYLDATVDRNIYIAGSTIDLKGTYNGNVSIEGDIINLDKDVIINGTLKYNKDAIVNGLDNSIKTKTYRRKDNSKDIKSTLIDLLSSFVHISLFAIVLIFIFEKLFNKINKDNKELSMNDIVKTCGKGFLLLIGVPIIAIMLLMTGFFVSVSVVSALLYGIFIYISSIITAYLLMLFIDKKYLKKNLNNYYLVICGLLLLYVVKLIPIFGGFVTFVSLIFGLGIIGNLFSELKK